MAASSDEPPAGAAHAVDPEEVLAAAEEAHLAARNTVPIDIGSVPRQIARRDTVRLPPQGTPAPPRRQRAPLALAAAVAAGWAAVQGFLPVLAVMALVQLAEGRTGSLGALARLGLAGWLLGHGVPLQTGAGALGLVPLALSAFIAWRVARAGVQVTRAMRARRTGSVRRALAAAGSVGLAYGVMGLLAALALDGPGLGVPVLRAGLTLAVFGLIAAAVGALGATGAFEAVLGRTPAVLFDGFRAGVVGALVVLGAGAGLAGLALALAGGDAADTVAAYRTGVAGQAGITLLCLAYAPNAATWAAAYVIGPGFAVGVQTTVRTTEVSLGALPAVPLFAGLPHDSLGGAGAALLAVPLAAGMLAGCLLARRLRRAAAPSPSPSMALGRPGAASPMVSVPPARPGPAGAVVSVSSARRGPVGWVRLLGAAALAGPVAGLVLGLAAAASAGPLGGGRLAEIGPVAWQVGVVGAGVIGAGTLIGAAMAALAVRPRR